jgi:exonuclease VII large subunit
LLLSQIKNSFAINLNLLLVRQQNMLNDYCEKLSFSVRQFLLKEKYDLQLLAKEAELNSPLTILSKGYAILSSEDGQRFFSTKDLSSNGEARLRMQDGEVRIKLI